MKVLPLVLAAFLLVWSAPAAAHLMPAKQGTVNVVGDAVFVVVSIPTSALTLVDDDHDGLLSARELKAHGTEIRAEVDRRLLVADGDQVGETRALDFVLSPDHEARTDRADQVIALKHVTWDHEPRHLGLTYDLFGAAAAERQLTITATRHKGQANMETEAGIFTPISTEHRFFRPIMSAWLDYVRVGAEHVLFGTDHLLFLLTVVIAGLGWRYWLRVVTGFTVAHSLTLGAAMLGYVRLSPHLVEPLIALSIVLMALDNLLRRERAPGQRIALVCACGLLHGLGFASSMDAMGLDSQHRVVSLIGFNLGVEVGQAMFLVGMAGVMVLGRKLWPRMDAARTVRVLSVMAMVVGAFWLVQRIVA